MCGRYYMERGTWDHVRRDFAEIGAMPDLRPGDIVPSADAPALILNEQRRLRAVSFIWGFPGFDQKRLLINARAESIREKPVFSDSILSRRCVLPAAGFYEWDHEKQKCTFTQPGRPVIYLAGIWRPYGEEKRFVIITREANASMLPVHDRMPLMIEAGDVREWLGDLQKADRYLHNALPELNCRREYEQLSLF